MQERRLVRSVIAVVQRKGGVGKTTISVGLAGELYQRGYRVSVIDADPQQSASRWAALSSLQFPVRELPFRPSQAERWAQQLASPDDDFTIIDTAPDEQSMEAAVAVATLALVPCTPSGLDLETTVDALYLINKVLSRRRLHVPLLLVPNRLDTRTLEGLQILGELHRFGEDVGPPLGSRAAFVRAFSLGQTVNQFAPGTLADMEMKGLVDTVEVLQTLRRTPRAENPASPRGASSGNEPQGLL